MFFLGPFRMIRGMLWERWPSRHSAIRIASWRGEWHVRTVARGTVVCFYKGEALLHWPLLVLQHLQRTSTGNACSSKATHVKNNPHIGTGIISRTGLIRHRCLLFLSVLNHHEVFGNCTQDPFFVYFTEKNLFIFRFPKAVKLIFYIEGNLDLCNNDPLPTRQK